MERSWAYEIADRLSLKYEPQLLIFVDVSRASGLMHRLLHASQMSGDPPSLCYNEEATSSIRVSVYDRSFQTRVARCDGTEMMQTHGSNVAT